MQVSGQFGPTERAVALSALQDSTLDLLVVGAGATGTGTALDAVTRGLSVGLIDSGDIAQGTSSRSSQLVHGGLRYLQHGHVALVRESLRERNLLLTRVAPTLVRPQSFLIPLRHRIWERAYLAAGLTAYDALARSGALPRHRHLSRRSLLRRFGSLDPAVVVGALEYHDAKMDDARMAVAIARTAATHGAHVAPHVALVRGEGRDADGVWGLSLRDDLTGQEWTVRARAVALCVGVWAPEVSALITGRPAVDVVRSKGVHVRLPRRAIDGDSALLVPTERSVLFVLPEPDHWLVGTTDTEWQGPPDEVRPRAEDVDYLLARLNRILIDPVRAEDVTFAFAGLRPLARDHSVAGDTATLTREHRIVRIDPAALAIVGGKWTTYRVMASDMVDAVLRELGRPDPGCRTERIALVDGRAAEVAGLVGADPTLAEPLRGAPSVMRAQVVQAIRHEGACTVDDVVDRRLRLRLHLDDVPSVTLDDIHGLLASVMAER